MTIYWKDRINLTRWACLMAVSVLLLNTSCKKENNEVGSDVIGNRSGFDVQVTDTFDVVAYSTASDSVDTRFLSYYMLGQMNDPELGVTSANLITQFLYPVSGFSFDNIEIDSVVLQLRYAGANALYGKNTSQTIKVYEITEDLPVSLDEYFYSNRSYQTGSTELGSYTGTFGMSDSAIVYIGTTRLAYAPQMRIKITDQAFINKLKSTPTDSFTSASKFKSVFKGLMISAEQGGMAPGDGAIIYLNMRTDNPQTALVVYGRQGGTTQVKYEFPIAGTNEVKANQYKHTYVPALQPGKTGQHRTTCYLQPCAGIKTRLLIPSLSKLAASKQIAVNSARLTVHVKGDTSLYMLPQRLNLWDANEDGTRKVIKDFSESITYYGGYYNSSTTSYTFNINRHVQNLLNHYYQYKTDINYGLNLFVPEDFPIAANRAILDTDRSTPGQEKVKLILTYTVIK